MAGKKIEDVELSILNEHTANEFLYRETSTADEELIESIRLHGVLTPIQVLSKGKQIISGHRRFDAAKRLGMETIPVIYLSPMHPEDALELLIEMNRQRPKTNEQRAREAKVLTDCEDKRRARLKREAGDGEQPVFEKSVREAVAEKLGVSQTHVKRSVTVTNAIDKAIEEGDEEAANEIREKVNQSVKKGAEYVAKPAATLPRPDAWEFDREGTIDAIADAEVLSREIVRCVKTAIEKQGAESDYSDAVMKKLTEVQVRLAKWKEGVR